ncbi:hypothetical protein SLA2020_302720 [Shorea laevis]
MGQKLDKMGKQQPRDELLYLAAIAGDVEAIKALCLDGAAFEWIDREGKTALIVACMNSGLIGVAKTLIEKGANINAYRPGRNAGTPLHHAAKRGLEHTVKLLLSHGANALVRNDDCLTPLDVARMKGYTSIVREIEIHICYFSGWMRELYGPGFLGGFLAPQLLSRKIWVVIIPCGFGNAIKPPRFELAIYSTLQDAQPRTVISLLKAEIEEPKFRKPDPSISIFDQLTKTRFKLAPGTEDDKQQLQWLYGACRGIPPARPSSTDHDSQVLSTASTHQIASEDRIQDSSSNHQISGVAHWENSTNIENYNGWGTPAVPVHPESSSSAWSPEVPKEDYNGWGLPDSKPAGKHNLGVDSAHLKSSGSGWLDKVPKDDYNGWGVSDSRPIGKQRQGIQTQVDFPSPIVHVSSNFSPSVSTAPSAPPIPNEVLDEGSILYPSIDLNPVNMSIHPTTEHGASSTTNNPTDGGGSSSCIICWEAPVEGACIPCGHMAGCMSCLNEIKAKKGLCPVCRANISQVVRLYVV